MKRHELLDHLRRHGCLLSREGGRQARSASTAVYRGSLGIHLYGGGEDLTAQEAIALGSREGFKVKIDCFLAVRKRFFKCAALRLTSLQFRAPRIEAVLNLLTTKPSAFSSSFANFGHR